MGAKSKIEWLEGGATWNFLYGCTKLSHGCKFCYAERVVPRIGMAAVGLQMKQTHDGSPSAHADYRGTVIYRHDRLEEPLAWTKPRRVFVNSLSDTFHEDVPDRLLDRAFDVMQLASHHTFIVLTKRAERLAEYLTRRVGYVGKEGLRNVWAGATTEDAATLARRAPFVQRLPTPVRLLSLEPLLEDVDVRPYVGTYPDKVNWIIVGGESGRLPRPMKETWARRVVDACKAARVPVFVKQMGAAWATEQKGMSRPSNVSTKGNEPALWQKVLRVREVPRG